MASLKVAYRRVRVALPTSTGTFDVTISGIGAPKGAFVKLAQVTADNTRTDGARWSLGLCDGTRSRMVATSSEDGVPDVNTWHLACNTLVAGLITHSSGAMLVEVTFDSAITDGYRFNLTTTNGTAYFFDVIYFLGDDMQCYVGDHDMANGAVNDTEDVTAPGFQPTAGIFLNADMAFGATSSVAANATFSYGMCTFNPSVAQVVMAYDHQDGAATSEPSMHLNEIAVVLSIAGVPITPITYTAEVGIDSVLSTGFKIKNLLGGNPPPFAYMAIKAGTAPVYLDRTQSPTSTGTQSFSHSNKPGAVLSLGTIAAVVGDRTNAQAGSFALGFDNTWGEEGCFAQFDSDAAATMDTGTFSDSKSISVPSQDGTVIIVVEDSQFQATQYLLNWTTVSPTRRYEWILVFEQGRVEVDTPALTFLELDDFATVNPTMRPQAPALTFDELLELGIQPAGVRMPTPALALLDLVELGIQPARVRMPASDLTLTELDDLALSPAIVRMPAAPLAPTELVDIGITPRIVMATPALAEIELAFFAPGIAVAGTVGLQDAQLLSIGIQPALRMPAAGGTLELEIVSAPGLRLGLDVPLAYLELFPFAIEVAATAQVLTNKKRIHDALKARAQAGDFRRMSYPPGGLTVIEGAAVPPNSIEFNESHSDYAVAERWRRDYREQRKAWVWELHLDFDKEVTTELFERAMLRAPLILPRDVANGLEPVIVKLIENDWEHPPRQSSSNGTKATYRFVAELHPV